MKYISRKQKKIIIVIIIITIGVAYYVYTSFGRNDFTIESSNLEINTSNEENNSKGENSVDNEEKEDENNKNKIIVHISGEVKNQGVVELEENSRVNDAIEKAGGVTENAYMKDINLAYKLEDGMKIYIPSKEEVENNENNGSDSSLYNNSGYYSSYENISGTSNVNSKKDESNKKVNINTANKEELDTLPGIGEATADKIIEYRNKNGRFKTKEEIKEVSGIGDSKYEKIKEIIEI